MHRIWKISKIKCTGSLYPFWNTKI